MQAALKEIKLKSSSSNSSSTFQALEERERIRKSNMMKGNLCEDSEDYHALMHATYLEKYFDAIEGSSMDTEFLKLSLDELKAILEVHESGSEWRQNDVLVALVRRIDECIRQVEWKQFFVRSSARSCKDAAVKQSNFLQLYNERLEFLKSQVGDKEDKDKDTLLNKQLRALYHAGTAALSVENGAQAMDLIIGSKRFCSDLSNAIENYGTTPNEKNIFNLVLREWMEDLDVENEMRAFVHNGLITGITVYNQFCYFPALETKHEKIEHAIKEYLVGLIDAEQSLASFVADLVFVEKEDGISIRVIELNPLAEFAGTGLFSWTDEEDRKVLLGASSSSSSLDHECVSRLFEFRYLTRPPSPSAILPDIPDDWKQFLEQ